MAKGTSKIVNAIHRLIKEEVQKQLEEKLKDIDYSEAGAADYYTGQESHELQDTALENSENMQKFSNNPSINKILNETAGLTQNGDYSTMGGGAYTTSRMTELTGGRPNSVNQASMEGMPNFLKKAMSGESAKVVKAMEAKNGTRRT